MIEYEFKPLADWPGPMTQRRKRAQFRAGYADTLKRLRLEVARVGGRSVVIQAALPERDIRLDGLPRADARQPSHPGVIVSFTGRHGALAYPCDAYDDWRDNLRAVALALEALRAVDRYGVTNRGQQYAGWKQLGYISEVAMTREQALDFLWRHAKDKINIDAPEPERLEQAYRTAALRLHPDRGGDSHEFARLQEAKRVLQIGG